jgi:cellulose synthase/poly-beta-1,6-N-acetylglucosamine synthase-like glycosyltransferase
MAVTEPLVAPPPRIYLPRPPDDREKYRYFGPPRRWVFCWLLVASAGVLYGYIKVAERAWLIAPVMWLLLMVMVPPVVVNFWLRAGRPRLTLAMHRATVTRYLAEAAQGPAGETVDVFLPSCGEPLAVLDNTFRHVSALTWHRTMTVYALDDSAREAVRDLADRYGFRYVVRPRPGEMKKAGNLSHALGISAGDFIAVIDADFAVRPEFLYETMPYFDDPKVGIVQTAQYYDVSDRSFSYIQRYAGTLQEIFFRFIQPARDRHKAAICALWWAGFETRYLPLCLAKGVAPTDFPSLANQQARWCRSSMMLMTERHFIEAPFTWRQRTAFWAAFLYYMSSAMLLLTGPFPTLTMIWCYPGRVYPHNYLPILPALAASLFAFPVLSRGWRPTIYRVCVINSCCHLYSVWYAIRGRVAEWVPTGASPGRGPRAQVPVVVNRILCTWIVAVQGLLWSGLALRVHQYGWHQYWATEILGGVQLYMVAPLMTPTKGAAKRARPREGTA